VSERASAISCSFCGRAGGDGFPAGRLVGKNGARICRDCLEVVTRVMDEGDSAAVREDRE
jgi:hypothetical protein